jgi:hypothetical protein
VETI